MVIDHIAIVGIDIIINTHDIGLADDGEIIGMLGGIGGGIVLDGYAVNATESAASFIGIARDDMGKHLVIHRFRNTHHKTVLSYHKIFASNVSSSSPSS